MEMNPKLPEGMLLEIFSRLPAKSVGRCRCLSKSWLRNLSSTDFIRKHLIARLRTIKQENVALITAADKLHIVTSPLKNEEKLTKWTGWPRKYSMVYGGSNGLLLIRPMPMEDDDDVKLNVMLLNPITGQQVNIPDPPRVWDAEYSTVYGFGYDWNFDDYKIIVLNSSDPYDYDEVMNEEGEHANSVRARATLVDVYSVRTGVWNRLDRYPYGELLPSLSVCRNGACVNGAVHWLICARYSGSYCHIAAFDLASEDFYQIPFPAQFNRNRPDGVVSMHDFSGIFVIGGYLSIVYNISKGEGDFGYSSAGTDVWMMKEYGVAESWKKFHIAGTKYGKSLVPLCMVGDDQLMCYTERDALVLCNLKDGTTEKVIVGREDTCYWGGKSFVDSLLSPEEV